MLGDQGLGSVRGGARLSLRRKQAVQVGQTCLPLNPGVIKSVPAGRLSFSLKSRENFQGWQFGC
jgi:hypothetical protein